ncbi:hypothetical protein WMY93_016963 [Mugilogobius chulae]|uniref:SSD domain-containing protein n=1 Tax=Mugilogobius chulae TaxID=88201 RepID=A0AAW0NTY3_9GOBI
MNSSPATVQGWRPCCSKNTNGFWETSSRKKCLFNLSQKTKELKRGVSDTSNLLFMKILPCGVVKFRYIWVCWFAVLAAGGTYMACVEPGMKLPTLESKVSQLFRSSHPFERYDAEYRHMFMFERQRNGEDMPLSLQLVWGVKATDSGDHFNPLSNNSLVLDPEFNMSSPDSQIWLKDFCARVQNQSFYFTPSPEDKGVVENICLVEQLVEWVSTRHCSEGNNPADLCCANQTFPFLPAVFEHCLSLLLAERYSQGHLAHAGGVYFHKDGRIAALVLAFRTTFLFSFNYTTTSVYYEQILAWFTKEKAGSPPGLARGWFTSQLSLLDLQQSLSSETLLVSGFSVALTFAFLLVSTWNIPLSLYGMVAVGGSVFVTIGLLVLLEWHLSGIEALFISCAAGLAVDFIANYCISYSLAPHSDKIGKQNCGRIMFPCFMEHTESCVTVNSSSSAANGAFDKNRVRRSYDQDRGGFFIPQSPPIEETTASHTLETIEHLSLCKDVNKAQTQPLWALSQSSYECLDSNDSCLSIIEAKASTSIQSMEEEQLQPGHLNEKRSTLRLSLKDTSYGGENKGRSSEAVILPNSKPDLPDVWIKRSGEQDDSS